MIYINCVVYTYACLYVCKYIYLSIFAYNYGSPEIILPQFFCTIQSPPHLKNLTAQDNRGRLLVVIRFYTKS